MDNIHYTILIVDDVVDNLYLVRKILENARYKTKFAISGEAAISLCEETAFDLMLIDVRMPVMNGFETSRKIKSITINSETPVLFFIAKTDLENIHLAFSEGGIDIITKPFHLEELLARVRIHLTIQKQKKQLLELNATKDKFFSIISHDLKGPFNSILGYSGVILKNIRESDLDKIEKGAKIIFETAKQTYNLLDDLLIWALSQSGKLPFEPQKHNLSIICNDIVGASYINAKAKNITINHFATEEIQIFADINMLKTILRNLVSNAIKFTGQDGSIDIYAEQDHENVTISVSDNGIGIQPEILPQLFNISKKISTDGTANEKGTGLGLHICKEFIEKHGGKIWVESEIGMGSVFNFSLPTIRAVENP